MSDKMRQAAKATLDRVQSNPVFGKLVDLCDNAPIRPDEIRIIDGDERSAVPNCGQATRIRLLPWTFDVAALQRKLLARPDFWNTIKLRTPETSPHREVDDIWVRYNPLYNYDPENPSHFGEEHESEWYPVLADLPEVLPLIKRVYALSNSRELGGVLITRVPAGKQVYPHQDHSWHANYYDKYAIQILGNEQQVFAYEGEGVSAKDGECYWFNNQHTHWVVNSSKEDRITLIVCVRG